MNKHLKWVIRQWQQQKWFLLIMFIFTLLTTAVQIAPPIIFRSLIDLLSNILNEPGKFPEPMHEVNRIVLLFIAIGFAQLLTGIFPCFRAWVNLRFEHSLRMFYFRFIVRKDYRFFHHFRTGDIVTRLTDDISDHPKISWFLCSGIFRAVSSFSLITFSLIVMFSINWLLTLLTVAPLPLMMVIFYISSDKLYQNFAKNQQAVSAINSQLEMSFSGIRIIKAFVSEEKYNRFFEQALARRFKTEMSMIKLDAILQLIWEYIDYIALIGVILVGGYMAVKGQISIGTFFLFYSYLSMIIYPLLDLPQLFLSGKQSFVNIDRLEEIKDYPTYNTEDSTRLPLEQFESLHFDQVTFTYPERLQNNCFPDEVEKTTSDAALTEKPSPVVRNCSFVLKPGERLLILGATGAGKTTIANLVLGLLQPSEGRIQINGIDSSRIDPACWREIIGYVAQEPVLFGGTIKENVLFAADEVKPSDYELALQTSQLDKEIATFPRKEETVVGNRGIGISGGQKQRVTIARALVKTPQLLILDDITASLDAENEERLWQDISIHYGSLSAIVISHRLSTLRYVDRILYIDKNGECHLGTHDELVFKNPDYHDFLHEHLKK